VTRLSRNERRNVDRAIRFVRAQGIELRVVEPLDARAFDAFLDLYEPQVGAMRHGVPFARSQRTDILDRAAEYFAVQAWVGDELMGSCVCLDRADASTTQIRFTTTTPDGRRNRVVRAMYMIVFQVARERCRDLVSLGTDPSLYGHIAKPGLFRFKSRLGFTPVPARIFGSDDDPDEAARVLRLDALTEPSLQLSYHLEASGGTEKITAETTLRLDVVTRDPNIDLGPYRVAFLADIAVRQIVT
jgi:hypothetical protein